MAEHQHNHRDATPFPRPAPGRIGFWPRLVIANRRLSRRQLAVLALAAIVALSVGTTVQRAKRTTADLGQTLPVLVATSPIPAGSELTTTNTKISQWPSGLIPERALETLSNRGITLSNIGVGEIITETRTLGHSGLDTTENAVLVPTPISREDLKPADNVALFGITPIGSGDHVVGAAAVPLANGRVIATFEQATSVAVPGHTVASVLEAAAIGVIEIVKLPG